MGNVESYIPKTLEEFSNAPSEASPAVFDEPSFDNPRATFWLGEVEVVYSLADLSEKNVSVGVVVPVIPAPTKKVEREEIGFYVNISINTYRQPTRIASVDPGEYRVLFDDASEAIPPSSWSTSSCGEYDSFLEVLSRTGCGFRLYFDGKTTKNVRSFVLISAPIAVDDVIFKFPDLKYEVGNYKSFYY